MNLRKREDTRNWKAALCGELALEEVTDL
jgi:hypothetical protein